jgi:DNA/RNA-binding domain of Phe-tRNA-synthetase-like protein
LPSDVDRSSDRTISVADFSHAPGIGREFPQLAVGVLLADGIRPDADAEPLLAPWYERARERLSRGPESELAEVSAWRRAYAQMGLKPTQYRSAAEALLRRLRHEGTLPRVHPLVDLCNALSLAFAVPIAVFDLAGVSGDLKVRHARGDEQHLAFNDEVETPEPGEIIYADSADHAHARRWTFRQSRRSTVSADTRRVLIVAEALHPTGAADVPTLLDGLAHGVGDLWGAPRRQAVLTAASPRFEIASGQ